MTTALDRIQARRAELKIGLAAKHLLAAPTYIVGWVLGKIWWLIAFWVSAFATGFEDGSR